MLHHRMVKRGSTDDGWHDSWKKILTKESEDILNYKFESDLSLWTSKFSFKARRIDFWSLHVVDFKDSRIAQEKGEHEIEEDFLTIYERNIKRRRLRSSPVMGQILWGIRTSTDADYTGIRSYRQRRRATSAWTSSVGGDRSTSRFHQRKSRPFFHPLRNWRIWISWSFLQSQCFEIIDQMKILQHY